MKAVRHLIWLCVVCSLCWAGLEVRMTLEHSSITGYDSDKQYTFRGKIKNKDSGEFVKVEECDLNYPTGTRDLLYTGERRGVSSDQFTGWDSVQVRRQQSSEDGRSSGDRTFKLRPKGSHTWVSKTISWTQYTKAGDPPPEG